MGIKKFAEKTGFTQLEIKVLLFLITVFIAGFFIKTYLDEDNQTKKQFDYSVQDSLFLNAGNDEGNDITNPDSSSYKNVDYKQEVLNFRKPNFNLQKRKELPAEKSIDINKTETKKLTALPGIGTKTAEKIIAYRNGHGSFKKLEDLLKVKGIGKAKFSKIKKYLYIKH